MKRTLCILLCLLSVFVLAVPVLAAGNVGFSILASSQTLNAGDTVTLTVHASSSEPATSYGLMLSYDTSVFELVSGNCSVPGALVNSFQNGFAFMFQQPVAYSGIVGTVTLKVKATAPLGSYTISGSASANNGGTTVSAYGCSTSVSVVCNHTYSAWTESGDIHQRTCSVCKSMDTAVHSWDGGTVIRQATCQEGGQVKYTCSECTATKTESTDKSQEHTYGAWSKTDDSIHTHVCSVCQKAESAAHSWDQGTVMKQANCKEEGQVKYTCTGCAATKTAVVKKLTTHTYDHGCDVDCNICGVTRSTTHKYSGTWSKDKTNHWHECSVCKDKKDVAAHTPGAEATETKAQTCTVCSYIIMPALGHKHDYAAAWTTDEKGHWYACPGCQEQGSYAAHDFENACDTDCSICGYTRETTHKYSDEWTTDSQSHWRACSGCGLKKDEGAHEPGAGATATSAQICTVCEYEIAPALGEPDIPTEAPVQPTEATVPEQTPVAENSDFPWWIVIIAFVAAAVCAIVLLKKKK